MGAGQLINGRLTFVWFKKELYTGSRIHIWDTEKGELQIVDAVCAHMEDLRISKNTSRVFCLQFASIKAWSILTGEVVSKVEVNHTPYQKSLTVDGSRVWVHSTGEELRGWDFGISASPPVQLSTTFPFHPKNTMLWGADKSRIKNAATGKVVFQLGGRFTRPADAQWDGWYLVAGYNSGEVLILDFNHVPLQ